MSAAPARRRRSVAAAAPRRAIVLDSSCWMEWFADTDRADLFAPAVEKVHELVVPVLTIGEVVKKLAREAGDETAAAALSLMQRGRVVEIDLGLALDAAVNGLPMADSLIYATARRRDAMARCCGHKTCISTGWRGRSISPSPDERLQPGGSHSPRAGSDRPGPTIDACPRSVATAAEAHALRAARLGHGGAHCPPLSTALTRPSRSR